MPTLMTSEMSHPDIAPFWLRWFQKTHGRDPVSYEMAHNPDDFKAMKWKPVQIAVAMQRYFLDYTTETHTINALITRIRNDGRIEVRGDDPTYDFIELDDVMARAEFFINQPTAWLKRGQAELIPELNRMWGAVSDCRGGWPGGEQYIDTYRNVLIDQLRRVEDLS